MTLQKATRITQFGNKAPKTLISNPIFPADLTQ